MGKSKKTTPAKNGSSRGRSKKSVAEEPKSISHQNDEATYKIVPIKRILSPDVRAVYSNHVLIRCETDTFHFFFFDAQAPLVVDVDSEEIKEEARNVEHIDGHCVARIVIQPKNIPSLISALEKTYESYRKEKQRHLDEKE